MHLRCAWRNTVTKQDGNPNLSRTADDPTDTGLRSESDRLSEESAEQTTEATSQESLQLATVPVTDAFVAWAPARRFIKRQLIVPDGKSQSALLQIEPIDGQNN